MLRKRLPWIVGLLVAFLVVVGVAYAAYTIVNITGEVTIDEAISVSPGSFTVSMYPAETVTETLTLNNAGSIGIEVNFTYSVTPSDPEITVTVPAKVTVPALGSTTADIDIVASKSAIPDTYTISVGVTR